MQPDLEGVTARAIGQAIRRARDAAALSTRELAQRIETSQPFVSNLENGRIFPSLHSLSVIAEALGVPMETLLPARAHVERRPATSGMRPRKPSEPANRLLVGDASTPLRAHRIELGADEPEPRPHIHEGEDFLHVLEGSILLLREGTATLELSAEEWTSIDGSIPHRLQGGPQGGAALLIDVAPVTAHDEEVDTVSGDEAGQRTAASIRAMRMRLGLSTRGLAKLCGISQPMLSHIETGRTAPSVRTLYAIADAMGVGPGAFLTTPGEDDDASRTEPVMGSDSEQPVRTTLLHSSPDGTFEVYLVEQPPGYQDPMRFGHAGEDIMHILEGRLTLGCGPILQPLSAGDTVRLTGSAPHWFDTPPSSGTSALVATLRVPSARSSDNSHNS